MTETVDLSTIIQIDKFIREFPGIETRYLPISKIGEGTFSTVYKAIDLKFDLYKNDEWLVNSLQDVHPLDELEKLETFVYFPEPQMDQDLIESTRYWRTLMREYMERIKLFESPNPYYISLKQIHKTSSPDRIRDEIGFIAELRGSPNVVSIVTAMRHEDQIVVVTPYFNHQDFRKYFMNMSLEDIQHYMRSLFSALDHVHSHSIIHRDVKPSNFLYSITHKRGLLVDFGLSQKYKESENRPDIQPTPKNVVKAPGYYLNDTRPVFKASRAGTRWFRAPEVLFKYGDQTTAIDIWSAGVVFLTLLTKRYPFFNSSDDLDAALEIACIFGHQAMTKAAKLYRRVWCSNISSCPIHPIPFQKLVNQFNPDMYSVLSNDAFDLLERLLDLDATKRITAKDALKHPFIQLQSQE
jgi:cell division control protein 7